ncbi:hypothetical protein QEN19_001615 [Hanseniaspora menglaensis]
MSSDPWSEMRSSSINDDMETVISSLSNNNNMTTNSNNFKLGSHRKNSMNSDIQQPILFNDEGSINEPSSPILRRTTLSLGGFSLQNGNQNTNNLFGNGNNNYQYKNHNSVTYPLNKISTFPSNANNNTGSMYADNRRGSYTLNNNVSNHGSSILKNPNVNKANGSFFESFGKQLVEATKEIESNVPSATTRSSFSEAESRSHSIKDTINSLNPHESYQSQQPIWGENYNAQTGFVPGFNSMYFNGSIPPNFMIPPGMMMFNESGYIPPATTNETLPLNSDENAKAELNKAITPTPVSATFSKDHREQMFGNSHTGLVSPLGYPMVTTPPMIGTPHYMPMSLMDSPLSPQTASYHSTKNNKKGGINNGKKFMKKKRFDPVIRSERLDNFIKTYKDSNYDLSFILDGSLEFCKDQVGSRFIQDVLPNTDEKILLSFYNEIDQHVFELMMDVFGNYVIQKLLEISSNEIIIDKIMSHVKGNVLTLTKSQYGCRIIQKALSYVPLNHKLSIIKELNKNSVVDCINDQNGNHVIQKAIENIPIEKVKFIIDQLQNLISKYATHPYGCRVIQRLLEYGDLETRETILTELAPNYSKLITNEFGNYVIQYILKSCNDSTSDLLNSKQEIINLVYGKVLEFSCHKYASNVVEQILILGDKKQQQKLFDTILPNDESIAANLPESELIYLMMRDQYANYVIQKMVKTVSANSIDKKKLVLSIKCYLKRQHQTQSSSHNSGQKRAKNLASVDKLAALVNNIKL